MNNYSEQLSNPMIESTLKDWREQGGLIRLEGSVCDSCNEFYYPPRFVCPNCHSLNLKNYKFSGTGTVVNAVTNKIPQIAIFGYREKSPRYMCIIKLCEGPFILGEVIDIKNTDINDLIGKKVNKVVRKQSRSANTTWKYGYKFKLLEDK
ncbi:Zn-ribbon domain-containing OB-fold protein [Lactiplantibacillus plantarum]|uniref:Zn-ribbon domain-containing OB-fold protein n=1 Tax=Lactiplantibacillus plantarum TaxID=1590 RepID=UPI000534679D|nr:zinc ribbon domain-containing protein [Lactiplantibacillus plantarum]MBO2726343.1 2,4-diacetylphloroglucinol biosynthesis protein [Lactiplantibacillus plantarum]MCG0690993.1 hypothetical protein [Lactiplantibacillus plantarum]MCG0942310.1 hypothetical protein [Lactiplantibacillus plantarum]MCK8451318.1 zinc ribbon domain-containing protein [Lactiplantibacillus plantarum]